MNRLVESFLHSDLTKESIIGFVVPLLVFVCVQVVRLYVAELKPKSTPTAKEHSKTSKATNDAQVAAHETVAHGDALPPCKVTVEQGRLKKGAQGNYGQYMIKTCVNGNTVSAWRRYSQVREFYRVIKPILQDNGEGSFLDYFPGKSSTLQYLTCSDLEPPFITHRAEQLDLFFSHLFSNNINSLASKNRAVAGQVVRLAGPLLGVPTSLCEELLPLSNLSNADQAAIDNKRIDGLIEAGTDGLRLLQQFLQGTDGEGSNDWKKYGVKKGVEIYLRPEGERVYSVGKGIIDAPLPAVLGLFADPGRRKTFDDLFESEVDVEVIDPSVLPEVPHLPGKPKIEFMTCRHTIFKAPAPFVAARDNLSVYTAARDEDGTVFVALKSVEHPKCPESKKYVRANVIAAGISLREISDTKCEMKKLEAVDPNGSLPKFVVNNLGPMRAMMVRDIGKCLKDPKKWPKIDDIDAFIQSTFTNLKSNAL